MIGCIMVEETVEMTLFKVMFSRIESTYRRLNGLDGVGRERGIKQNFLVFA